MSTESEPSNPNPPLPPDALAAAARVLEGGGIVAYPTETVWGLAAHPDSPAGLARLVEVKSRDPRKPLQVSCVDAATALLLAQDDPALRVLARWWPGPLTVVAPASARCDPAFAPGGRVGLRVPDHPVARALLHAVGGMLITTSCNVSGHASATTHAQAVETGLADIVLPDGGVPASGRASTVVALPEGEVVREGGVSAQAIRDLLAGQAP
ncbi:L-threonylcarbamoyladenylate synthase [Deinococcus metalli]|uniref:L-threonylcarbamoyladenylate synthase n=1 Tax=Deinococcus metalli TaxID=1141878 RepID=A0A7W8NPT3_9DEIO|nr:L-threonylcarbamoyladenylate synthase [Deinococcus metalli]MBB5375138.1 L-threonylcarbamoyladenylate synthase [Deinococcus metalli]GHF31382.1 SUA5-like protein [Deinococcus metalli]